MKKILLFLAFLLLLSSPLYAVDTEVQDLIDITSPAATDDMYIVDDPDVTPISRKISIAALFGVATDLDNFGTITANAVALTTDTTGNYSTGNAEGGDALVSIAVEITDNESTAEENPLVFVAGADPDGGDLPLETDGTCTYNPSTGGITATGFVGALTGNADTVTTNANLTGPITSTGNATAIASQTGTGTKFVVDTSPTLVTPVLGVATATTINKVTLTAPATAATITATDGTTTTLSGGTHSGTNTGDNTVATTGDSATAFFSSGAVESTYLDTAVILSTEIDTFAELDAIVADEDLVGTSTAFAGGDITGNIKAAVIVDDSHAHTVTSLTVNTADIADVSVTATELAELETIGVTTISANQWTALGGMAETVTFTEIDRLDGLTSAIIDDDKIDTFSELDAIVADEVLAGSASTNTFTNKTVDANGTGNVYTNFDEDNMLAGSDIVRSGIEFIIDGGGSAITTGIKGDIEVPFACTLIRATALCDQSGSIVVDIWKDSYANYPPTNADTITSATPVTVTTATKSQDTTLTSWTTAFAAGDTLRYNVDSATTVTRCLISLVVEK